MTLYRNFCVFLSAWLLSILIAPQPRTQPVVSPRLAWATTCCGFPFEIYTDTADQMCQQAKHLGYDPAWIHKKEVAFCAYTPSVCFERAVCYGKKFNPSTNQISTWHVTEPFSLLACPGWAAKSSSSNNVYHLNGAGECVSNLNPDCPRRDPVTGFCEREVNLCPVGGNPIRTSSGAKLHQQVDVTVGNHESGLELRRVYNSHSSLLAVAGSYSPFLGKGWFFNWSRRLVPGFANFQSQGFLVLIQEDGDAITFVRSPVNKSQWIGRDGDRDVVTEIVSDAKLTGYQLRRAATDVVETYSAEGKLLSVRDRAGRMTTLTYSDGKSPAGLAAGQLIAVRDHFGRELKFSYMGTVVFVTTPDGSVIRYEWSSQDGLARVVWPDGSARKYLYGQYAPGYSSGREVLIGVTDENGQRISTFTYDNTGRAVRTEQASGINPVDVVYTSDSTATVIDRSGPGGSASSRTFSLQRSGGTVRPVAVSAPCPTCGLTREKTDYDSRGRVVREVAHSGEVIFTRYDADSRPIEVATFPSGYQSATTRPALSDATRVVTTTWHDTWNLPLRTAEPLLSKAYAYDARGNLTSYVEQPTADANGSQGFAAAATGNATVSRATYNADSQLLLYEPKLRD